MTYISVPDKERRLVFYLAMEEYVAAHLHTILADRADKEAFFMWQVSPTVIFGRNQVMEAEVNIPYCKDHGVNLFRRKSGGGCVYSDKGNIMLSYITDTTDVAAAFGKYLDELSGYLSATGVNAYKSGRNDVMIDGKKVSGNAFFLKPRSSIVHGTMLFDTDFDALERAITPSGAKIQSKGVSSVRQHVTNLKPLYEKLDSPLRNIDLFKLYLKKCFCSEGETIDEIVLSDAQIADIEEIEAGYLNPDFLMGRNHRYSVRHSGRISGVGEICLELDVEAETVTGCHLSGDFFPIKDGLEELVSEKLNGKEYDIAKIREALGNIDPSPYVAGLGTEAFLSILKQQ